MPVLEHASHATNSGQSVTGGNPLGALEASSLRGFCLRSLMASRPIPSAIVIRNADLDHQLSCLR